MDIHNLPGALAMVCITLGVFILLHIHAEYLEQKAVKKWWKENSPTNFDIEK